MRLHLFCQTLNCRGAGPPTVELLENRRLLSVGPLDPTWGNGGVAAVPHARPDQVGEVLAVAPTADGGVVAVGDGTGIYHGLPDGPALEVDRYNSDGNWIGSDSGTLVFDNSFQPPPFPPSSFSQVQVEADGSIIAAGYAYGSPLLVVRFTPDLTPDPNFGQHGQNGAQGAAILPDIGPSVIRRAVSSLAVQPDGKILAGGRVAVWGVSSDPNDAAIFRFNSDGTPDTTFGNGGYLLTGLDAGPLALQSDGKIVAAGLIHQTNGTSVLGVRRFNANGSPDLGFGTSGMVTAALGIDFTTAIRSMGIEPGGRIVVAGGNLFDVAAFTPQGQLDTTFGRRGVATASFKHLVAAPYGPGDIPGSLLDVVDGKIVVAGEEDGQVCLVRYLADGRLDRRFGKGGRLVSPLLAPLETLSHFPSGQVLTSGLNTIARFAAQARPLNSATVSGTVFVDENLDKTRTGTFPSPWNPEPGLAGAVVFADLNRDGKREPREPATTTAADGTYQLSLPRGTYHLALIPPRGYAQTVGPSGNVGLPESGTFKVTATSVLTNRDFGAARGIVRVAGIFQDSNHNGVLDPGEKLVNFQAFLDLNHNGQLDAGDLAAPADGLEFVDVPQGNWPLDVVTPPGWVMTTAPQTIEVVPAKSVLSAPIGVAPSS